MGSKRIFLVYNLLFSALLVTFTSSKLHANQEINEFQVDNGQKSYFFYQEPGYPRDCKNIQNKCPSSNSSGVFLIKPDGYPEPFEVYCDNDYQFGGWTVIQRRNDGFVDFNRDWQEYKNGFGFLSTEFWLGNEKLSYLTNQAKYELRIDIVLSNGTSRFASHSAFRISDEWSQYNVVETGNFHGNIILNCSFEELPNVINGSIQRSNCSGNSVGDVCSVTCDEGYYPTSLQETICQYTRSDEAAWSNQGNLSCYAPACSFSDLPGVTNGVFDVTACSGNTEGDVCRIVCPEDYHPSLWNHTICEHVGNGIGEWTNSDFSCIAKCKPSWQGHSYTWVNTKMSWADADTHCRSISAHLVYINDAEENSFVRNLTNCDGHVLPPESYASVGLVFAETLNDEIRLVGGSTSSEGRVEVLYGGEWGSVCDDLWEIRDGLVVCRQLGFKSVDAVYSQAYFGEGSGRILLDDVGCYGSENRLVDCQHNGFGIHDCRHREDAGVKCTREKTLAWQDGAEAIYTNWRRSPPQNSGYCVGIDNNGLWGTYTCESLNYFVCEKANF